jgi:hypothetical protein
MRQTPDKDRKNRLTWHRLYEIIDLRL